MSVITRIPASVRKPLLLAATLAAALTLGGCVVQPGYGYGYYGYGSPAYVYAPPAYAYTGWGWGWGHGWHHGWHHHDWR